MLSSVSRRLVSVAATPARYASSAAGGEGEQLGRFPRSEFPVVPQEGPLDYRARNFNYMMVAGASVVGTVAVKNIVGNFIGALTPGRNLLAVANIEINLKEIPEGHSVTFGWRGKPLFVRHREQWEIDEARKVALSELKDPQSDEERVKSGKEQFLVLLGICTHLGCVPLGQSGLYKGWFCPCHGSHYDTSGRVRAGPAPRNLEVPPYKFIAGEDNVILVGEAD